MSSGLHVHHADVRALSNQLFAEGRRAWELLRLEADAEGSTVLALLYRRIREVRDAAAREAFARQVDEREVAREWLAALRNEQVRFVRSAKCAESRERSADVAARAETGSP